MQDNPTMTTEIARIAKGAMIGETAI
ncbi:hypothetical protein H1P_6270003 [Hyella patelloides LEGE 07179]|uniref:Uncharacterized protein n=1 Tax=Hyella patelloides LEGE 07179 TaxID=945734 RepID=A0A563W1I8_9CYAN|nr:hypothetical protein H1P_6270003 [Hyella patelloides LEGE 07179]